MKKSIKKVQYNKYLVILFLFISLILFFLLIIKSDFSSKGTFASDTKALVVDSTVIKRKVFLLIYMPEQNGVTLTSKYKWSNPDTLSNNAISFFTETSGGKMKFQITKKVVVKSFTTLLDGYRYNFSSYDACLKDSAKCHSVSLVNYSQIIKKYDICSLANQGIIDEVWIWGGPYFGFYESTLVGKNGFWYNSEPILNKLCNRLVPIMGLNYERKAPEMIESFGHRVEATMDYVYPTPARFSSTWKKFTTYYDNKPFYISAGGCGDIHRPVNSLGDYGVSNKRVVPTYCDGYLTTTTPSFTTTKNVNCDEWGCNAYGYLKYWFKHLPRFTGYENLVKKNWWYYVADPNNALSVRK